jgi:hypothetical protein
MKKLIVVASLALIAAPLMVALVGVRPAMAATTECSGTLPPGTYDNIVVPEGAHCEMVSATVNGNVRVLAGASLRASASQIGGNVQGQDVAWVCAQEATQIGGNFYVKGGDLGFTTGVSSFPGVSVVMGNIKVEGNAGHTIVSGATVDGNVRVSGNTGSIEVPENRVRHGLRVEDNVIPVAYTGGPFGAVTYIPPGFEDDIEPTGCGFPEVLGLGTFPMIVIFNPTPDANMEVSGNSGPGSKAVVGNTARRVRCFENTELFVGGPNVTAQAEGQCSAAP